MKAIIGQKTIHSYFLTKNIPHNQLQNELIIANALKNLKNQDNRQTRLEQAVDLTPHLDFKKRISILKQSLKESEHNIQTVLITSALIIGITALSVLGFMVIHAYLKPLKEAALSGRVWIYDQYSGLRLYNIVDWYMDAITYYSLTAIFSLIGFAGTFAELTVATIAIKNTFIKNLNIKRIDIQEITYAEKIDPEELINQKTADGDFLDPLTGEIINKDQINRSAYLKVGPYLFTLKSLIKALFKTDLDHGLMKHPIYHRYLLPSEQEEILEHLSINFGLSKEKILNSFNMSPDENLDYQNKITNQYIKHLEQTDATFRSLSLEKQKEYIAANKEKKFQRLRLSHLNTNLDQRIGQIVDILN